MADRAVWGTARRREQITVNSREGCADAWVEWQTGEEPKKNPERAGCDGWKWACEFRALLVLTFSV